VAHLSDLTALRGSAVVVIVESIAGLIICTFLNMTGCGIIESILKLKFF
jgi:hypothetical protein